MSNMISASFGRWTFILLLQWLVASILIDNGLVEATSRRTKPQRRVASRSRRGLIDSLGALDHTGKAADGWNKILDHLNGSDSPSVSPGDRAGTGTPSIIEIPTDPPSKVTTSPTQSPTILPVKAPTKSPSSAPTKIPTKIPTKSPTKSPTKNPTKSPTKNPTSVPVSIPTITRTDTPTAAPNTSTPSPSLSPTKSPTKKPTGAPTKKPTLAPTKKPTLTPTGGPTKKPTLTPTGGPTKKPTLAPTKKPTVAPTLPPTGGPTKTPSKTPTSSPIKVPAAAPTIVPQVVYSSTGPTVSPTTAPKSPSPSPTVVPSESPSEAPTNIETSRPVSTPTIAPTRTQTSNPTTTATTVPSETPSSAPSPVPTVNPLSPTAEPTVSPSESPSAKPSLSPTKSSTMEPTATPSATASPTLTMVPTKDDVSDSAVLCPDVEPSNVSMLEVWWIYSVHFNADVDRTSAMTLFEMKLAAELEDEVLQCNGGRKSRRLEGREGIVGIDYLPLDEQLDEVCPGVSVNCEVYKGTVSLYLENDGNVEGAIEKTRKTIIDLLKKDADGIIGEDISQIEYLSPDMQTSAAQGSGIGDNVSTGDESAGAPTAAMVSIGVVCAAMALTMGYRYKNRVDDAALSTIGPCGSQMTMTSSQMTGSTDGTPGLSELMPSTYRLGGSRCMDAILEGDSSDTSSQARNVSIVVSESGYSEEDSRTLPREKCNLDQSGDYLLGAHRVQVGGAYSMDQLFDDSFSDIQSPYDSSFEESFPTHRRTYTGQSNALGPSPLAFLDQDDSEEF